MQISLNLSYFTRTQVPQDLALRYNQLDDNGKEGVIAYASRSLTKSERKAPTH